MVTWQIFVLIVIAGAIFREFFSKRLVNRNDPFSSIFLVYLLSAPLVFIYRFLFFRETLFAFPPIFVFVGALFGIAIGAYYGAIKINLSKSALFTPLANIIVLLLAAIFLAEYKLFDPTTSHGLRIILGVTLAFISLWLLNKKVKGGIKEDGKWLFYITAHIVFIGAGLFLVKYFLQDYNPVDGIFAHYLGGAFALALINKSKKKKFLLPATQAKLAFATALFTSASGMALYLALSLGPATLVIPAQSIGFVSGSVLIGLFLYGEKKQLDFVKTIGMVIGFLSAILLLLP